jgi:predicted PurR-regulated permease PerM
MYDGIEKEAKKLKSGANGPILTILLWIWIMWALIFLVIPAFISLVLVVVVYAPVYLVDQKMIKRRYNG